MTRRRFRSAAFFAACAVACACGSGSGRRDHSDDDDDGGADSGGTAGAAAAGTAGKASPGGTGGSGGTGSGNAGTGSAGEGGTRPEVTGGAPGVGGSGGIPAAGTSAAGTSAAGTNGSSGGSGGGSGATAGSAAGGDSAAGAGGADPLTPWEPQFEDDDFVGANGTDLDGGFRFVGVNLDPWRFETARGEHYDRGDFDEWFGLAKSLAGATVIRCHMNGGAFEPEIGTYDEVAFAQLDAAIAAAETHELRVVIALRDYLWSPWPPEAYDPYWYLAGGTSDVPNKDGLFTEDGKMAFQAFVAYVLNRENTVTGRLYKDEPAVLGWELVNEPNLWATGLGVWLADLGAYVHTIDEHHLVGVAVSDGDWLVPDSDRWDEINQVDLDFIDGHHYPPPIGAYDPADEASADLLTGRITRALELDKVYFIGEFGMTNTASDEEIETFYDLVAPTAFEAGATGVLAYSWGPAGPNGWGGPGGFNYYDDRPALAAKLKGYADGL